MTASPDEPGAPPTPDGSRIPRTRRVLWVTLAIALLTMALAGWQLEDDGATPTASGALDLATAGGSGDGAPLFAVPLRDGTEFALARHLEKDGRPVLLNLWASWCIPCRNEMPLLDDLAPEYPGVLFLGVAVNDTRTDAERFASQAGVSYLIGFDEAGTLIDSYPAPAMPVTYVITADGDVGARFFGELTADRVEALLAPVL